MLCLVTELLFFCAVAFHLVALTRAPTRPSIEGLTGSRHKLKPELSVLVLYHRPYDIDLSSQLLSLG